MADDDGDEGLFNVVLSAATSALVELDNKENNILALQDKACSVAAFLHDEFMSKRKQMGTHDAIVEVFGDVFRAAPVRPTADVTAAVAAVTGGHRWTRANLPLQGYVNLFVNDAGNWTMLKKYHGVQTPRFGDAAFAMSLDAHVFREYSFRNLGQASKADYLYNLIMFFINCFYATGMHPDELSYKLRLLREIQPRPPNLQQGQQVLHNPTLLCQEQQRAIENYGIFECTDATDTALLRHGL